MEELFRFLLTRPAQALDPSSTPVIPVVATPDFHMALVDARNTEHPVETVHSIAEERAATLALPLPAETQFSPGLKRLWAVLRADPDMGAIEAATAVTDEFGHNPADLAADAVFSENRLLLGDRIIIQAIIGPGDPPLVESAHALAAATVVFALAGDDPRIEAPGGVAALLQATLELPGDVFPLPLETPAEVTPPPPAGGGMTPGRAEELGELRAGLQTSINELTRVAPEDIALPVAPSAPALESAPPSSTTAPRVMARFVPTPSAREQGLRLTERAVEGLSEGTRALLQERSIDLAATTLPAAIDHLAGDLAAAELELLSGTAPQSRVMITLGSELVPLDALLAAPVVTPGGLPGVPTTHGSLKPAGIGDLLVVRQFLKRYEPREIAHVENILQGESKSREHRRARTTEETFIIEEETKKEEERDLQSTERSELQTEVSRTTKSDASLKQGLTISASYGPSVDLTSTTELAASSAKEEATKTATSYSKDVTARAASKVSERRRTERILRTVEVFEELNKHGIDNTDGSGHVIGQYQWVDKIYEAQVFNYGKRLLFDLMIPEPAAFVLHAAATPPSSEEPLVKPAPFTLTPAEIDEWGYTWYVQQYEAVGVAPPPQPYITIAKALAGEGQDGQGTQAAELPVKDGYQAISGFVIVSYTVESGYMVFVTVGKGIHQFDGNTALWRAIPMANEVENIPFTVLISGVHHYTVAVEVHCQRTQRALDAWKLETHAAILQAYQQKLRDYEDAVAQRQIQAGIQIEGRNPGENERLIRTEIKKSALALLTAQQFDHFGAIVPSAEGYPQLDLTEAGPEGRYIRFFENAFEWEQLTFFFYPYFWGRKGGWIDRALLGDVDPLFADFIRAGSARVVLPVRPGFERAVGYFLASGKPWNGGDLPWIGSGLYVSIIDEIRERDDAPGDETPSGDPWDVRLPTSLVILRQEAGLPAWEKNDAGEWVPV
jgi:hypothetical protein